MMSPAAIDSRSRATLTVLDLFCGCGGMALGFERAGFRVLGGLDVDPAAIKTFSTNLIRRNDLKRAPHLASPVDITEMTCAEYHRRTFGRVPRQGLVDVLVGGPPCQAFARIGRAKLREVMKDQEAHLNDHRAGLYMHLLGFVDFYKPAAVVIENVPDMLNYGGRNVAEEISSSLEELGYVVRYTLLNAAHYGVPQLRTRLFLIAYDKRLGVTPSFPWPTHHIGLPKGYKDITRSVATQYNFFEAPPVHYVQPPTARIAANPAVTVGEALGDLPEISMDGLPVARASTRTDSAYRFRVSATPFTKKMRAWPRHGAGPTVRNHVSRHLPRDGPIFRRMKPGDDYPAARRIAEGILIEKIRHLEQNTERRVRPGSDAYKKALRETVPPYDPSKFPDKWRKLRADRPSHTLTAHLGKDSYSHIHYDYSQGRVISVREAARLQSFPDGFWFPNSMNPALRQIGNAVPPLLSLAIAREVKKTLLTEGEPRKTRGTNARAMGHGTLTPDMQSFRRRLLTWEEQNAADYPWRKARTPYTVIVAEFMLHRTRAKQVVPTYVEFVRRYPTLEVFARGKRRAQRGLLNRLGLSWRSDGMIRALSELWSRYGRVPTDYERLLGIPGIGPYIAGATVCFSKNDPIALVDSNTVRVVGRVFGLNLHGEARRRREVVECLQKAAHPSMSRDYHFALIDLAHTICRPRDPKCATCPLLESPCKYGRAHAQEAATVPRKTRLVRGTG